MVMMKVVKSLGMGAHKGGARQAEKSDCLEEHVGWMMCLFVTKMFGCLNEVPWNQTQIFCSEEGVVAKDVVEDWEPWMPTRAEGDWVKW